MSGNLSHQIEHHLFPDLPARRYPEMAVEVREICQRYGLPYNTGSLGKQLVQRVQEDRALLAARRRRQGGAGARPGRRDRRLVGSLRSAGGDWAHERT
nr:fatty acid desaturase [Nocardioides convexus]